MITVDEIIDHLKTKSSKKYKDHVTRLGIPSANSLGVSILELRKLAKKLPNSNELADQLWKTQIHEAQLLSVLVTKLENVDPIWAVSLMNDVKSWDLCDHLCKNLLYFLPEYEEFMEAWQYDERLYFKRACFSLIATAAVHDKMLSEQTLNKYLFIIENHTPDDRLHVRKAISWALREIGKKEVSSLTKAKKVANKLLKNTDKHKQWVGKSAMKELELLVPVKGRKRLVSKKTKTGKQQTDNS